MTTTPNMPVDTAAVSWVDASGNSHIRVYSSDGYNVTERCWDAGGWTTSNFAAQGSQVSATCYLTGGTPGQPSIRVYVNFEDTTTEWCQDNGAAWYVGGYSPS